MHSLFIWIACGLATLLLVACVVAWYEHLDRSPRHSPDDDWGTPLRRAVSVDVELDTLSLSTASGDVGERRQALGGALSRMASGDRRQNAGDTVPMILAGAPQRAAATAAPADRRQRARATASH